MGVLDYASLTTARLVTINVIEAFALNETRTMVYNLPSRKFFLVTQIRAEFVTGGGSAFQLNDFMVDGIVINAGPFTGNPLIYRGNDNTFQTTANTAFPACEIPVRRTLSARVVNSVLADSYKIAYTGYLIDDPDEEFKNYASLTGSP